MLDNNGKIVSQYNGGLLHGARCCHATAAGSVLVSGWQSNNIVQFTSNGDLMGEVVKVEEVTGKVWAVWCNQQMSEIYISRNNENNINVYDTEL